MNLSDFNDTIAAIATPFGEGGIGIIRISGKMSISITKKIFRPVGKERLENLLPNRLTLGYIYDPKEGSLIDQSFAVFMPSPHSYTGEDVVEFQCHGGIFLLRKVLSMAIACGARQASHGEFTKRAFLNGRLDLTQAESIVDIIKADSDSSIIAAASMLDGKLSHRISRIEGALVDISASIEALIDFPDDEIEADSYSRLKEKIGEVKRSISDLIEKFSLGRLLREGAGIVISGKPNTGKSSLLNSFLKEDRTIVSKYPGTTRDTIEESVSIDGVRFKIKDTAGIRKHAGEIEKEGISRAIEAIKTADIVIFLLDANSAVTEDDITAYSYIKDKRKIVVANKCDLSKKIDLAEAKRLFSAEEIFSISAKKGVGIDKIREKVKDVVLGASALSLGESGYITRRRHRDLLIKARTSLKNALKSIKDNVSEEFIVFDISQALRCLGEITGKEVSDDIIDKIFSEFCIGK